MNCETLNQLPDSSPSTSNSLNLFCISSAKLCPSPPHYHHPDLLQSMLCSFPTTATSSSRRSKWLHRLRASKGFPSDTDHQDLEQFLLHEKIDPNLNEMEPESNPISAPPDSRLDIDGEPSTESEECRVLSNALSELFCMGNYKDLSRIKRKKSCRKQRCPRICLLSKDSDIDVHCPDDRVSLPLQLNLNNRRETKRSSKELKLTEHEEVEEEEEKEKVHADLSGYSRTEVTVIDTSVPSWKFEKMLFRRNNVWKVRDKKGKGVLAGDGKKRKMNLNENGGREKKKLKLSSSSSKYVNGEECVVAPNAENSIQRSSPNKVDMTLLPQGHNPDNQMDVAYEKTLDDSTQVQEKSFSKKQHEGGSSVILIKSIPTTSKKNLSSVPKSCVKSLQKQHKA